MIVKSTEAWIIHKKWQGDSSAQISFFTPENGLIQGLYRGGRTPKKQALLQAFTPLWVHAQVSRGRYYIQSIESQSVALPLQGHSLFSALYLNEILYYLLKSESEEAILFDAYVFSLQNLAKAKDKMEIEATLRRFEWTLLRCLGAHFSLTCEARSNQAIVPDCFYQFVVEEGFVRAPEGFSGASICALSEDRLDDVISLRVAKIIMRQAINHLLNGREIKARSLYSVS